MRGGACGEGPGPHGACSHALSPCQPIRSLRARRARFVAWCAAAAAALCLLGLSGPWWRSVTSPGPLTAAHAKLQSDCTACHPDTGATALAWVKAPATSIQTAASACVKCHTELGARALDPHGLDPAYLAERTARLRIGSSAEPRSKSVTAREQIACATCHREHRGGRWNIASLRDSECQACHVQRFKNFAQDHPEFKNYPATRRQRIVFDHRAHIKHIKEEGGSAAVAALLVTQQGVDALVCSACHHAEQSGRMLPINGFAPSCTTCHHHAQQLRTAAGEGIAFVRLPGIDAQSLEKRGYAIGEWPREAQGPGWDGPLTPFMRLLLSSDAEAVSAMQTLDAAAARNVFLFDLYDAKPNELRAAQRLVWGLKGLLVDMADGKQAALLQRLSRLSVEPNELQALIPALSGELPIDQPRADLQGLYSNIDELRRRWMPTVADEVTRYRAGQRVVSAHVNAAATTAPTTQAPAAAVNLDDLLGDSAPAPAPEAAKPAVDLNDLLGGDTPPPSPPPAAPDPRQEQELADAVARANAAEIRYERAAGALGQAVRWSLRELDFSIRYRPVGHADPFLKSWLDVTARSVPPRNAPTDAASASATVLFAQLADIKAGPGMCTRCHSVDADAAGMLRVQWQGDRPEARRHSLTWFDHAPHLRVAAGDCSRCHRPSDAASGAFLAGFVDGTQPRTDPFTVAGHFQNVTRALCAECHHDRGAPSDCSSCHRYHTGGPVARR